MELKHDTSNKNNRFYLLDSEKEIGEIAYSYINDDLIDIYHTEVNPNYRGQNLGQKLIEAVVGYARDNKLKAKASCPYVAKVFGKTDQYNDIKA